MYCSNKFLKYYIALRGQSVATENLVCIIKKDVFYSKKKKNLLEKSVIFESEECTTNI